MPQFVNSEREDPPRSPPRAWRRGRRGCRNRNIDMQPNRIVARVLLTLAVLSGLAAQRAAAQTSPSSRVLLISCDGLRPDAIDKAGLSNIQSLIAAGSYQPRGRNQNPPVTLPNHTSMVTGLSVDSHGVRGNHEQSGDL